MALRVPLGAVRCSPSLRARSRPPHPGGAGQPLPLRARGKRKRKGTKAKGRAGSDGLRSVAGGRLPSERRYVRDGTGGAAAALRERLGSGGDAGGGKERGAPPPLGTSRINGAISKPTINILKVARACTISAFQ